MHMTLHAMLMIHMQKLGPGNYGGEEELTSEYSQTCKPKRVQNPDMLNMHIRIVSFSHSLRLGL